MYLEYSNTVYFIDRIVKGKLIKLSPATKRMFCNFKRFVFAHTRKISNCCCKNLELISNIDVLKTTAIWNHEGRIIIFELKEFSQVRTKEFDTIASKLHSTALLVAWAQQP